MENATRKVIHQYYAEMARLNGISDAKEQFAVEPSVEKKLQTLTQQSSGFLQKVNYYGVKQQSGEKIGLSIASTIAGRTDTTLNDRVPVDPTDMTSNKYKCEQTNFDTSIPYAKMDAWSEFPDFMQRIGNMIAEQIGRDRLMIGWNGTSVAANTNRVTNPFLQDVNIGWLEKLRLNAPARYMTQGATAGQIRVGPGGDYKNLDHLVYDMRSNLLAPWYSRNNSFTVCCDPSTIDDKYLPMVADNATKPMESSALDQLLASKKLGGLKPEEVPFFPGRALFITILGEDGCNDGCSNLSVYWQKESSRRLFRDKPERNAYQNFQSINEAYEIEDYTAACAAVNIKFPDGLGGWA